MSKMSALEWIAIILLVISGLVHGLLTFGVDVIGYLPSIIPTIVYALVGLAAVYSVFKLFI